MEIKDKDLARENFITAFRFIEENPEHFIKDSCHRSTLGRDHLNSLILLSVKHSMSKSLNFDEIYDVFAKTTLLKKLLVL